MNISNYTIKELQEKFISKELTVKEAADFYLDRIRKYNQELNAYITVVDEVRGTYDDSKRLSGIPLAIKDVIITKGIRSTGGSKILDNYIPPYNATVINKLKEAEYTLLGKTNCDEFAQGSSNENSAYGPVKNPWDTSLVAGGTSGGSAVAVAADLSHAALGTDTGGSVRQPASFCGVVGIKPTYGRVSRYGLIAIASSLDQCGVLARRVEDAKEILSVIEGVDELDATSSCHPRAEQSRAIGSRNTRDSIIPRALRGHQNYRLENLNGIRIGVPKEYFAEGLDIEVERIVREAILKLKELGAEIIDISMPYSEYALATYYIIMPAEVSSNMARYDGIRYGKSKISDFRFCYKAEPLVRDRAEISDLEELYKTNRSEYLGEEVKRRIMLGTYVLSAGYYDQFYGKAQRVRQLIRRDFVEAFKLVDVIVGPVAPTPAFKLGEKTEDPFAMYLSDIYTVPVNLAGFPALSVPAGFASGASAHCGRGKAGSFEGARLPVGLHMIGKWWDDHKLLSIAEVFERATEYYKVKPILKE